jgi:hypothetical protein
MVAWYAGAADCKSTKERHDKLVEALSYFADRQGLRVNFI